VPFLLSALSIILIDLLLAGDNALVIAMAVRSLPRRERRIGIVAGAAAAVVLRVALTLVAARMLTLRFIQLAGGILVLWIAVKVLQAASESPNSAPSAKRFWQAIRYIVVADVTMSTDNILAIAGASHGNNWLIVFGLCLSVPFVVLSSDLLSRLMDRYTWMVYIGSGILGRVGAEMILSDPVTNGYFHPSNAVRWAIEALAATATIAFGWWLVRRRAHLEGQDLPAA
jgi:YjbE family integral membrane protein